MVPRHALFSLRRCLHAFDGRESIVYKQSMFRRPSTVPRETVYPLRRSCSLIGTVILAPRKSDGVGAVYTFLEVEGPSVSSTPSKFQILLNMYDQLAEISFKHLKVDDFIYVRGPLSSYEKLNVNGQLENMYKVVVEDLNFVYRIGENKKPTKPDKLIKEESTAPISFDSAEETMDRLRLWQIFFANPHEWWDNREHKLYPTSPDFRHKDTHECLRLMPNDPPWIQRQLQRYDSSTATQSDKEDRKYSKVRQWEIQDLE
ncbi:protein OSB1, mitochondrial-like isoform X1 [Zingiber officinale]|uniref:protein OSB1, mitochondrial-like isoform X1 n=1 Tax=Zingiber officinale TaxID=94328 RepID=UPI001C4B9F9E|nr:protein OSB1, mitochondrial-like isoform X1 [Zingiber officinale]